MKNLNAYELMGLLKAKQIEKQLKKQKGATMIEYALVIAGVAAIAAILFNDTTGTFTVKIKEFIDGITLTTPAEQG